MGISSLGLGSGLNVNEIISKLVAVEKIAFDHACGAGDRGSGQDFGLWPDQVLDDHLVRCGWYLVA